MIYNRPLWQKLTFITFSILLSVGVFLTITAENSNAQINNNNFAASFVDDAFHPLLGASNNPFVAETVIQPDGKILVSGDFNVLNGLNKNGIARFNPDGTLDTTFDIGSGANNAVFGMSLQSDGKIIVSGLFTSFNSTPMGRIARLNPDGSLDTTFNAGNAGANNEVSEVYVLPDNKILIGGVFTNYNGTARNRLARLNSDGSLDTTFSTGTGANSSILTIDVQPDGKAIIGGNFVNFNGTTALRVARINTDGSLDTTFPTNAAADFTVRSVKVQPDGKVLVGGLFANYGGVPKNAIVRLNRDATLDSTFNVLGTDASILAIKVQPNGKIIVGGSFATFAGGAVRSLARLNADGTLDPSFDPGTSVNPDVIQDLELQTDGKIILVGTFGVYNGVERGGIARVNSDGSLDTSLPTSSANIGTVNKMVIQPDGKILVGGNFATVNGTARTNLARLNQDGTLDTTFMSGTSANGQVRSLEIQPDNKIVIGGSFTNYNGTARNRIARINADGTLDTTFDPGTGFSTTSLVVALQTDGKVLVGGQFVTFNGVSRPRIARLNADGSLDTTFNPGTGANTNVTAILPLSNGKTLVGGNFVIFNGLPRNRLVRLNANGSLDSTFVTGNGATAVINDLEQQPDGKVLAGGAFSVFQNKARTGIARFTVIGSTPFDFDGDGRADLSVFRPTEGNWFIQQSTNGFAGLQFGVSTDKVTSADFDGDGKTDVAVWRENTNIPGRSFFYILNSGDSTFRTEQFGSPGDDPSIVGDFDGDGKADPAVYRNGTGGQPSAFYYRPSSQSGVNFNMILWGTNGDKPMRGDFDGDGKLDAAVFRPSNATWYILQSSNATLNAQLFGAGTDTPVPSAFIQ